MLKKFLPKEDGFFKLFREAVNQLVEITKLYRTLVADLPNVQQHLLEMQKVERTGDKTIKATFNLLHKTFITPFDRYDIHRLTNKLDNLVDAITRSALTIQSYEMKVLPPEISIIANLCYRSAKMIRTAIEDLESLKNTAEILKCCDAVSDAEDTGQELILTAIGRLFKEEADIKQLLKTREIYDGLKHLMESFQMLANIIRTIVLEYA